MLGFVQKIFVGDVALRATGRCPKARGVRGDVALGHGMRKFLALAFAVWKTNRPFDPNHYPWASGAEEPRALANAVAQPNPSGQEKAVGHTRESPAAEVVTTAGNTVKPPPEPVKGPGEGSGPRPRRPQVDFAWVRQQVSMEQVLERLGVLGQLRGRGLQRRGPCPIHGGRGGPGADVFGAFGQEGISVFSGRLWRPWQCVGSVGRSASSLIVRSGGGFGGDVRTAADQGRGTR